MARRWFYDFIHAISKDSKSSVLVCGRVSLFRDFFTESIMLDRKYVQYLISLRQIHRGK